MGPEVPLNAWMEVEVARASSGPWRLYLGWVSDEEAIFLDRSEHTAALVASTRSGRRVLAERNITAGVNEVIWVRRHSKRWSIWLDGEFFFSADPPFSRGQRGARVAFSAGPEGAELARLSVKPVTDPKFFDEFMREHADSFWLALKGSWELAGVRMPELSANPFALRASFRGLEAPDPFTELRWKPAKSGLGVNLSSWRGVVQIERITGNGPAARAGLREDDIVLAIDDRVFRSVRPFTFHEDLEGPEGSEVALTILRPGELKPRRLKLRREIYRWAQISYGEPLPRTEDHVDEGIEALAVAGESSWDDYRFEASVMCPGGTGGAGLAFAVRGAESYYVFGASGELLPECTSGVPAGSLFLIRARGTERRVLAQRFWRPRPGTWYRFAVDLEGGRIAAFVDGVQVLEARDAELPAGRIGLWAIRGEGAYFDDVAVSTDRQQTAPARDDRAPAALAEELDMRRWANPSDDWLAGDDGWWHHLYRFPGDINMTVHPEVEYTVLEVVLGCANDAIDGTVFALDRKGRSCAVGGLSANFDPRKPVELGLCASGRARLKQGDHILLETAAVRRGDQLALRGVARADSLGAIRVSSSGVREYHFRHSPTDWAVVAGRWGIMNKWICDPRFSWFGGHSRSLAAIWHKHPSRGDVTLDFYAALVMVSDDPPYERVGDFACTILGDGRSLDSGYTLVISGGRNRWTRLYGGGRLLAESVRPEDRLPSNVWNSPHRRALHQRWFRITLERRLGHVRAALDGRELFSLPDELGVERGHVALWTQDNGMLVGRARIASDSWEEMCEPWGQPTGPMELCGLTNKAFGEISSRLALDGMGPSGEPAVLVENICSGGSFAAASTRRCSPRDRLSFDFRAEKNTRVDLCLEPERLEFGLAGPFRIVLTGPVGLESERHPILGGPYASDDGQWHRVELDLGRLFDAYQASRIGAAPAPPVTMTPTFACLEEGEGSEYLPAGLGGNRFGARYWVSNFRIEDPIAIDREEPRVKEVLLPGEKGTPEGFLRIVFEDDLSGVDPKSIAVTLRHAGRARGSTDTASGGSIVSLTTADRCVRFEPGRQELEIDLIDAGIEPPLIAVDVTSFADRAGKKGLPFRRQLERYADSTGPVLCELELLPRVLGELELDFEHPFRARAEIKSRLGPESPIFSLEPGPKGLSCRLTVSRLASPFIFRLFEGLADVSQLRMLSFDYRMPDQIPINIVVRGRRNFHGIIFTDRDDPRSDWSYGIRYAGEIEGAVSDGKWHHAQIELAETFRKAYPQMESYPIQAIYLMDWGWNGLWPGDGYWLDNLRIEGVRRGGTLSARWRAFDISGVSGVTWSVGKECDASPPERSLELADMDPAHGTLSLQEVAHLSDGEAFLNLKFVDRAGNWSRTYSRRIFIDNTPPKVVRLEPADGASSSARQLSVQLEDFSGVIPSSLQLRVGKEFYRADGRACWFDAARRVLTWSARGAGAEDLFTPGARIEAELVSARDIVGNELRSPVRWSWRYDPQLDRRPPPRPKLRFTTGRPYSSYIDGPTFGDTNDFERELGGVDASLGCSAELCRDAARSGSGGVRVTVGPERGGEFILRLRERYWFVDERPFFMFDMRLARGRPPERLALRLELFTKRLELEIDPPRSSEWRRYAFDLGEFVRRSSVEFPEFQGEPYKLAGQIRLVGCARPGTALDIDDVELALSTWRDALVECEIPEDESGIDGFAVVWDRSPDTIPPELVTHPVHTSSGGKLRLELPPSERRGIWFLHVRAKDNSGNWGETSHLRIDLLGDGRIGGAE